MTVSHRKEGVLVPPQSTQGICAITQSLRTHLGLMDENFFPVIQLYEVLNFVFPGAWFQVFEDHDLPDVEARTFPDRQEIRLRNSVYEAATRGDGRSRFTLTHEIGHLVMHKGLSLNRAFENAQHKIYCNSEWQADIFASNLLMPSHLLQGYVGDCDAIANDFGTSYTAAEVALSRIRKSGATVQR